MEALENIEKAVIDVKRQADVETRLKVIKRYLSGTADPDTNHGKALLHRRALFVTAIAELKLWPDAER